MATARNRTWTVTATYRLDFDGALRPNPIHVDDMLTTMFADMPGHIDVSVGHSEWEPVEVPDPAVLNREALVKVVAWVAGEHAKKELGLPSEWDQDWWYHRTHEAGAVDTAPNWCGTAACVAGKVAIMAGGVPDIGDTPGEVADFVIMPDGERRTARTVAQQELGLNDRQADVLFAGSNTYEDILHIAGQILNGEVHPTSNIYPY